MLNFFSPSFMLQNDGQQVRNAAFLKTIYVQTVDHVGKFVPFNKAKIRLLVIANSCLPLTL